MSARSAVRTPVAQQWLRRVTLQRKRGRNLFHELVEERSYRRGFGRTGIDVNHRWQHVCENAPAVRIQGHVSADGEEVFAISDCPDAVRAFVNGARPSS